MNKRGILKHDDFETLSMMFLSLNFGFIFLKASFGDQLTTMDQDCYIRGMVEGFINGI